MRKSLKDVKFQKGPLSTCSVDMFKGIPAIQGHIQSQPDYGDDEVCGWFLGTRCENADVLSKFVQDAINSHKFIRRNFHPEDPTPITEAIKKSPGYLAAIQSLEDNFSRLNSFIAKYDTPFYSMRYQGHMTWDTTLPSLIGYFTAMLHNPNNVTMQASTSTTLLEWMVGFDICKMVGFRNEPQPWSHITCDGSVANLEALWATRELRLFPLGVKDALEKEEMFSKIKDQVKVELPDGTKTVLLNIDTWGLLNLATDAILRLPGAIAVKYNEIVKPVQKLKESDVWKILKSSYSVNALGIVDFTRKYMKDMEHLPAVIAPSTRHYSWTKSAFILGLGTGTKMSADACDTNLNNQLIGISVDEKARMDMTKFKKAVDHCFNNKIPLLLTVAVLGSTEESDVDPLDEIVKIRDEYLKKNFYFNIHVDAAWGGYQVSTIRKDFDLEWPTEPEDAVKFEKFIDDDSKNPFIPDSNLSKVYCNEHTIRQFKHIREADSVTIDPHKCGYIPYPAGSVAYRNGDLKMFLFYTAPYIDSGNLGSGTTCPNDKTASSVDDYSIGEYGVEGSKPGAAAAAVFLSHSVIRPSVKGYGKILNRSYLNTKLFYIYLVYMAQCEKNFFVIPLQESPKDFFKFVEKNIYGKSLKEILQEEKIRQFIKAIGPDQNIFNYAFNFYIEKDGRKEVNKELKWVNAFNQLIYDKLHIQPWENAQQLDLMITMTTFNLDEYGSRFIGSLGRRLKIETPAPDKIPNLNFQRSVVMDPWVAETYFDGDNHLNFYQFVVVPTLLETVRQCVSEIKKCMA